ncbi:CAP domain-containing protein [Pseudotabrizicola sediminis]|uniref:CAP domain-containing protein n=1 Tax=Pseudotabrizicola sediminis TaxID=2486418 RepID=A0ABY2KGT8_9RHOB|nr:CAP domain-containing protein [Pseudotabrizicola sediminis]
MNVDRLISCLLPFAFFVLIAAVPAAACTLPTGAADLTRQLVVNINQERARAGLRPFRLSGLLSDVAQRHACENASQNRLSHRGTDGSSPGTRALRVGYDFRHVTENVALGHATPDGVLRAWLFSSSHRQNIFDPRTVDLGVAVAVGQDGRLHWVMNGGAL